MQILEDIEDTCREYDIDKTAYREALGENYGPLKDKIRAAIDDKNPAFLSKKERLWYIFAEYADRKGNKQAVSHFRKPLVQFGFLETVLFHFGVYKQAMFHRHIDYRTWSRWEKILYLSRVPEDDVETVSEKDIGVLSKHVQIDMDKAMNLVERSDFMEFVLAILRVFSLIELINVVRLSIRVRNYYELPWRVFDAVLNYISYLIQLLFPLYVIAALIFFPICY